MNFKLLILLVSVYLFSVGAYPTEPCTPAEIDKLTPDTQNCSRFYECTRDGWVGEACNPGLEFNPDTLYCDYPANVHCATEIVGQMRLEPCTDIGGLKPDPDDCSKYYQCSGVVWVPKDCPSGLDFNPNTLQCDFPFNVNCSNATLTAGVRS